jgi:hypothetical protein
VLNIYTYPFLHSNALLLCQRVAADADLWQRVASSFRVITASPPAEIIDRLMFRHAISIEGVGSDGHGYTGKNPWVKRVEAGRVMGYAPKEADVVRARNPATEYRRRFAIVAWSPVNGNKQWKDAYFIHTWGVNMEHRDTIDAHHVFNNHGEFIPTRYLEILDIIMNNISMACSSVHSSRRTPIVLRITALGFGAWATEIPLKHRKHLMTGYLNRLADIQVAFSSWLDVRYVAYPTKQTLKYNDRQENWSICAENSDNPWVTIDPKQLLIPYQSGATLVFCNSWDELSYIGNGGSKDHSLDGWTVAGGTGISKHFTNASFLHNPFFHSDTIQSNQAFHTLLQ